MTRSYDQLCPIARTLDLLGDRWTLLIIRELIFGRTRFSDLRQHLPGIPMRVLSERLKRLEEHGVIERQVYSDRPLRAKYQLTRLGRSLEPVMRALADWGVQHLMTASERKRVPQLQAAQT